MRVAVDRELCRGNGQCEAVAPKLFHLDEYDVAVFSFDGQKLSVEMESEVAGAVAACPVAALVADG
jgi:ferredoxin